MLQADGGTRRPSAEGSWRSTTPSPARGVAALAAHPLHSFCAAVSVGIVGGVPVLDLPYAEDSTADVDMNVVTIRPIAGGETRFVEVQGTAEGAVQPLRTACVARPGRARARRDRRSPGRDDRRATPLPQAVTANGHRRPRQLVCVPANPSKVAEIVGIVGGAIEPLPRPSGIPDVVEDAGTLVGNARLKAAAIAAASGVPGLADDTGLEVAALGGLPGVDTATYAGPGASTRTTGRNCSPPRR